MPVPGFLTSFADKAQSAINASPLASHLPGHRASSPDEAAQPPANDAATGGQKSHTFESLQYQLRAFGQQYSSTTPIQKIITTEKGVAIDLDSLSRDSKAQSKELYTWGQNELDDLKDVTDRLAYLNFVAGSLSSTLAVKLDGARAPLKLLRDAENALAPRRNIRTGLSNQLARLEHDNQKGTERKISELKQQIHKAETDDQPQEKEIELLKRKAIRESEQLKWDAIREYGEKLVLLSQASGPVISVLPTLPPSAQSPYTGGQATGAARASLQRALDNYKTGHINLPPQVAGTDLSRSDTRSFGESHASELSSISSNGSDITAAVHPSIPMTPPLEASPGPEQVPENTFAAPTAPPPHPTGQSEESRRPSAGSALAPKSQSPPIDPSHLNLAPASIPDVGSSPSATAPSPSSSPSTTSVPIAAPNPETPVSSLPPITPTVAETGVPVAAGANGPGPASGSLRDIKAASADAGPRSRGQPGDGTPASFGNAGTFETADEEKKRLAREYSQVETVSQPPNEIVEDEKKRLEREERERPLRASSSTRQQGDRNNDDELPAYQDM